MNDIKNEEFAIKIKSIGQGEEIVTLKDVMDNKFDKDSGIDIFLQTLVNLKTRVNYKKEKNVEFKPAKVNKYTFMLISALKIFIDRFCVRQESYELKSIINSYLTKNKDEFFFTNFAVEYDTEEEYAQANAIIDALGVKFYQQLILNISVYLAKKNHQVFIVKADEKTNSYIFRYRLMSWKEQCEFEKTGSIKANVQE